MVHLIYICDNRECSKVGIHSLVSDLAMDVRYVEEGDVVDCSSCDEGCYCYEVND